MSGPIMRIGACTARAEPVMRWWKANERYSSIESPSRLSAWCGRSATPISTAATTPADGSMRRTPASCTRSVRARIPYLPVHLDDISAARRHQAADPAECRGAVRCAGGVDPAFVQAADRSSPRANRPLQRMGRPAARFRARGPVRLPTAGQAFRRVRPAAQEHGDGSRGTLRPARRPHLPAAEPRVAGARRWPKAGDEPPPPGAAPRAARIRGDGHPAFRRLALT